jgi:hypothetical protein
MRSHRTWPAGGVAATGGERNFREIMLLTTLFGVWYGTNIMFNVYNKQLFAVFKYPITTTCVQVSHGGLPSQPKKSHDMCEDGGSMRARHRTRARMC